MKNQFFARKPISSLLKDAESHSKLPRVLGPLQLTALGIGMIIGAGIFVTPGVAAHRAGPAVIISFVVAAFACALAGLCYAEFAAMVPVAGSAYTYTFATAGELLAWIIGWDLILEYAVAAATVAQGASEHFQQVVNFLPSVLTGAPLDYNDKTHQFQFTGKLIALPALILTVCVTAILVRGLRQTAAFNTTIVFMKVGLIILVIIVGAISVETVNWGSGWHGFAPFGIGGILAGASTVFFAFIGFDSVSNHAEDSRSPQSDVPIGIISSLGICTLLYVGMALVLTGMVSYASLDANAPVVSALAVVKRFWLQRVVAFGAIIGIASVMVATMLSQSRILLAMARDGLLPRSFFGDLHNKLQTPWKSIIVSGVFVGVLSSLLPLSFLLALVNIGTLAAFILVSAAVIVMRRINPTAKRPFRVPFFPLTPILSIAVCLLLAYYVGADTWLRLVVWLILGLLVYLAYGRKHSLMRAQITQDKVAKLDVLEVQGGLGKLNVE
jgi:basic amino acid/polyamine antiporter, APA family